MTNVVNNCEDLSSNERETKKTYLSNIAVIGHEERFVEQTSKAIDEEEDEQLRSEIVLIRCLQSMIFYSDREDEFRWNEDLPSPTEICQVCREFLVTLIDRNDQQRVASRWSNSHRLRSKEHHRSIQWISIVGRLLNSVIGEEQRQRKNQTDHHHRIGHSVFLRCSFPPKSERYFNQGIQKKLLRRITPFELISDRRPMQIAVIQRPSSFEDLLIERTPLIRQFIRQAFPSFHLDSLRRSIKDKRATTHHHCPPENVEDREERIFEKIRTRPNAHQQA